MLNVWYQGYTSISYVLADHAYLPFVVQISLFWLVSGKLSSEVVELLVIYILVEHLKVVERLVSVIMASIAELVANLHSNLDSIHKCIESLSNTHTHDEEMESLEQELEAQISSIRQKFQAEAAELERQRQAEEDELAEKRRRGKETLIAQRMKEEEEIAARRKREDDERKMKFEEEEWERLERKKQEDTKREIEAEERKKQVQEQIEQELERLENEMERKISEGKQILEGLNQTRRAINAQIDAALKTPTVFPTGKFRSRAKSGISTKKNDAISINDNLPAGSGITPLVNDHTADEDSSGRKTQEKRNMNPELLVLTAPTDDDPFSKDHRQQTSLSSEALSTDSRVDKGTVLELSAIQSADDEMFLDSHPQESTGFSGNQRANTEDPEDFKSIEEIGGLTAELLRSSVKEDAAAGNILRSGMSHPAGNEQKNGKLSPESSPSLDIKNDHYRTKTTVQITALEANESTNKLNAVFGVHRFFEEQRPPPLLTRNATRTHKYHFREELRPRPTFIYRFSEQNRPSPIFEQADGQSKIYRFFEELRPSPRLDDISFKILSTDSPRSKSLGENNIHRFTENTRPSPLFLGASSSYTIHRLTEADRPNPLFTYRFSEEERPPPVFRESRCAFNIYRFLEENRPVTSNLAGHYSPVTTEKLAIKPQNNRGIFRFKEDIRRIPLFHEGLFRQMVYHYSEGHRPPPSFYYHFSEVERPLPVFYGSSDAFKICRFSEEERPKPSFATKNPLDSVRGTGGDTIKSRQVSGVFRFSEENRPPPSFIENLSLPYVYNFSEQKRPRPLFIHRFFERNRPVPSFNEVSRINLYRFSEESRHSPQFDVDSVYIDTQTNCRKDQPGQTRFHADLKINPEDLFKPPESDTHDNPDQQVNICQTSGQTKNSDQPGQEAKPSVASRQKIELITRPITPPDHDISYHIEESPVTVMDTDDLFVDDNSGDGEPEVQSSQVTKQQIHFLGSYVIDSSIELEEPNSPNTKQGDIDLHGEGNEKLPGNGKTQRRSGLFAPIVDAIKADVSLVKLLANSQEYNSVPSDDFDPYSDDVFERNVHNRPVQSQRQHVDKRHLDWQPTEDDSDEEFPIRLTENSLHIRTTILDTVPSFEPSYHSVDEESPTTPSDAGSSPFLYNPHGSPSFTTSWPPPKEDVRREEMPSSKPQASPLRADFEQTYQNYVTSNLSLTNLTGLETLRSPVNLRRSTKEMQNNEEPGIPVTPEYITPILQDDTLFTSPLIRFVSPISATTKVPRISTTTNRRLSDNMPVGSPSAPINQSSFFRKTRYLF
jgi:hypothetical protein